MSGMYYRVEPEPIKHDGYGFKKVNPAEVTLIVERVSKTTYSSRVAAYEPHKIHNYDRITQSPPPRTPSSCPRRVSIGSTSGKIGLSRPIVSEHELQRLVRRVRKPTRASELSRRDYDPDSDYYAAGGGGMGGSGLMDAAATDGDVTATPHNKTSRPVTASERKKAFDLMSRPTTASRAKSVTDCHLCDEKEAQANKSLYLPFQYPYAADDQSVSRQEVASIVSRISSPTKASQRGAQACWCVPPSLEAVSYLSERLPLVSGMGRSRSVKQIVNRLHHTRGTYRKSLRHGYDVKATPISDFSSPGCRQDHQQPQLVTATSD